MKKSIFSALALLACSSLAFGSLQAMVDGSVGRYVRSGHQVIDGFKYPPFTMNVSGKLQDRGDGTGLLEFFDDSQMLVSQFECTIEAIEDGKYKWHYHDITIGLESTGCFIVGPDGDLEGGHVKGKAHDGSFEMIEDYDPK